MTNGSKLLTHLHLMVEKSVKLSSKNRLVEIMTQALASKSLNRSRNLKICGSKGAIPSRQSNGGLAEDLSDISDTEVTGYLNNKKEFLLKKIAWELMNPEYQKGKQRKPTTVKKKEPANKTAPSKKFSTTRIESSAKSENKERPSPNINYDVLDKLFDAENSPKRASLEKPVVVGDYSQQSSEESLLKPQVSEEEEEEPEWNEEYTNEDAYGRDEEFYSDANLEIEDQDDEGVIW